MIASEAIKPNEGGNREVPFLQNRHIRSSHVKMIWCGNCSLLLALPDVFVRVTKTSGSANSTATISTLDA
nr:hypothetical protein pM02_c2_02 [uncultured bacterium]